MSKEELQKIVADLAASNSKEASVLTEGVKEMIDTCRNTCVSLKESIQGMCSSFIFLLFLFF